MKKPRRAEPNLIAKSKLQPGHGFLTMAKGFAQYELRQQSLREGDYSSFEVDELDTIFSWWHVLEHLFDLPTMPDADTDKDGLEKWELENWGEVERLVQEGELFKACMDLEAIQELYIVIYNSVDLEIITAKKIDAVLAKARKGRVRSILSAEQFNHVGRILSDASAWDDPEEAGEAGLNLWQILHSAQSELDEYGELSTAMRQQLLLIKDSRLGARRQRLYAPATLVLLLAEYYDSNNQFGHFATLRADRYQTSKTEHELQQRSMDDGKNAPWSQGYKSKFSEFLRDALGPKCMKRLGFANAEGIMKHRNKFGKEGVSAALSKLSTRQDFSALFSLIDKLKA